MITCIFESGQKARIGLRHVTVGAIACNEKGEVLLVKRSNKYSRPGRYSVPGGFLERGQTIQEAVLRELKEETGYDGEIVALFHINDSPTRPHEDRQNVDFIYLVKITGGSFEENDEVDSIAWLGEDNLPDEADFAFDHRTTLMRYFAYRKKAYTLPLMGAL